MHAKDVNWKEEYQELWMKISRHHQEIVLLEHKLRVLLQDLEIVRNRLDPYQGDVTMLADGELVVRAF